MQRVEEFTEELSVMGLHAPRQREAQGGQLLAQASFGQLCEDPRVGFPCFDCAEHPPPTHAHDVTGDGSQFEVGRLQHLVDTSDLLGTQLDERLAVPREIAQDPDRGRRDKAGP